MAAATLAALAGCATATPAPTRTVTASPSPAVTVTASAAPVTADTPLTALTAWTACGSFLSTQGPALGSEPVTANAFSTSAVTSEGSDFRVHWAGSDPDLWVCTVPGTLGSPVITDWTAAS